jgi:hypothetical protein
MSNDIDKNNQENIDFALQVMRQKFDNQNLSFQTLESKIGILLGFVGVIAGSSIVVIQNNIKLLGLNIFTIGIVGIFITLISLTLASKTRIMLDPPDFPTFYSGEALQQPNIELKNQVIADMKASYQSNLKNQEKKASYYNFALLSFLLSLLFLFLGIFLTVISKVQALLPLRSQVNI